MSIELLNNYPSLVWITVGMVTAERLVRLGMWVLSVVHPNSRFHDRLQARRENGWFGRLLRS